MKQIYTNDNFLVRVNSLIYYCSYSGHSYISSRIKKINYDYITLENHDIIFIDKEGKDFFHKQINLLKNYNKNYQFKSKNKIIKLYPKIK